MAPAWKPAFELPKVDVEAIIDVDTGAVVHGRWLEQETSYVSAQSDDWHAPLHIGSHTRPSLVDI
jgi:hypothetical protein